MNKIQVIGRLTADPELTSYGKGKDAGSRCSFTVASKQRGGSDEHTDFLRCVSFGKLAEILDQYLSKGDQVIIFGHISNGSYETKDGEKRYTTDVIVEDFEFGAKKQGKDDEEDEEPRKGRRR